MALLWVNFVSSLWHLNCSMPWNIHLTLSISIRIGSPIVGLGFMKFFTITANSVLHPPAGNSYLLRFTYLTSHRTYSRTSLTRLCGPIWHRGLWYLLPGVAYELTR